MDRYMSRLVGPALEGGARLRSGSKCDGRHHSEWLANEIIQETGGSISHHLQGSGNPRRKDLKAERYTDLSC